jgi:hypothetical protein
MLCIERLGVRHYWSPEFPSGNRLVVASRTLYTGCMEVLKVGLADKLQNAMSEKH